MSDPVALWALSQHDEQYVAARRQLKALPRELAAAADRVKQAESSCDEARAARDGLQEQQRTQERRLHELRTNHERAAKALRQGFGDYQAAQRQVEQTESLIDEVETGVLELMEAVEGAEERLAAAEAALEAARTAHAEQQAALTPRTAELEERVAELAAGRKPLRAEVTPTGLRLYDRMVKRFIPAVATVASGACKACNRVVGPNLEQQVRRGLPVSCVGCGRLLVLAEQIE